MAKLTKQTDEVAVAPTQPRWRNGLAVVPMRVFLGCLFTFAGYAKLSYPGFLDSNNQAGFKAILVGIKSGSPIGGLLQPMIDHAGFFGHLTAFAEIAIGLGLLVGLLTRVAAVGGIALTTLIALSVNWSSIKQYTGSYGWFTSVDIAVAVALTVFVLGGAGPLSGDRLFGWLRARRRGIAPSDGYHQPSIEESMERLRPGPGFLPMQPEFDDRDDDRRNDRGRDDRGRHDIGRGEKAGDDEVLEDSREPATVVSRHPEGARIDEPDLLDEHDDLPPAPGV